MLPIWAAFAAMAVQTQALFELCNRLARKKTVDSTTARCGLQFLLNWFLFPDKPASRLWAGSLPLLAAARYGAVGTGLLKDQSLIASTSRTGDRREFLKGPFAYGIIHGLAAILFWRQSPVGITAIALLCAGDGSAELVGRRLGRGNRLPHNPDKSWAGTLACASFGGGAALAYLVLFRAAGYLQLPGSLPALAGRVAAVSVITAAVESLPLKDWDNVTVAAAAAASSAVLLR